MVDLWVILWTMRCLFLNMVDLWVTNFYYRNGNCWLKVHEMPFFEYGGLNSIWSSQKPCLYSCSWTMKQPNSQNDANNNAPLELDFSVILISWIWGQTPLESISSSLNKWWFFVEICQKFPWPEKTKHATSWGNMKCVYVPCVISREIVEFNLFGTISRATLVTLNFRCWPRA
jgi:hypothetical protein